MTSNKKKSRELKINRNCNTSKVKKTRGNHACSSSRGVESHRCCSCSPGWPRQLQHGMEKQDCCSCSPRLVQLVIAGNGKAGLLQLQPQVGPACSSGEWRSPSCCSCSLGFCPGSSSRQWRSRIVAVAVPGLPS